MPFPESRLFPMPSTIDSVAGPRRSSGRDSVLIVDHRPDLSALAPVWVDSLERNGLTSPARVALWLDDHREPPSQERVDMVVRRMRGKVGVVEMAVEEGVPHSRIQAMLRQTAMELIVPRLEELAAWARARSGGVSDESIADLSGTEAEVLTLALDGWPARDRPSSEARVVEAYSLWTEGAHSREVATVLGTTPRRLRRDLADGTSSLPRRLEARDLADRFGWNHATVTRYRVDGLLPTPDGRDGVAYWWWAATIDHWAQDTGMHSCPSCRSRYLTETGLRGHVTREH